MSGSSRTGAAPCSGMSWEPQVAPGQAVPSVPQCSPRHGAPGAVGARVGVPGWAPWGDSRLLVHSGPQ